MRGEYNFGASINIIRVVYVGIIIVERELSSCGDGSDNYNKGSTASENIGPPKAPKPPKPRRSARIKQLKRKQDDERSPKCTRSGRRY